MKFGFEHLKITTLTHLFFFLKAVQLKSKIPIIPLHGLNNCKRCDTFDSVRDFVIYIPYFSDFLET